MTCISPLRAYRLTAAMTCAAPCYYGFGAIALYMIKRSYPIMSKLIVCILGTLFATSVAFAQAPAAAAKAAPSAAASDCASKAVGKNGKPLAGAAKDSFMKKCEADAKGGPAAGSGCAEKAVGKDGKPLAGAAKASFMKKCEADAKGGK